jgi:hypothetical protein
MYAQRTLAAVCLTWLALAASPAAAAELPTLPTFPGADTSLDERRGFYLDHQITTQFMGKPCIYRGGTYFYYQLRHILDASPDAAQHRRNAIALKVIGLSVAIPAFVAVLVMAIAQVDPLKMLIVAIVDLATVIPLTIGQMVELDKSVRAYDAWLREQLVLDPIGEALGTAGGPPLARGVAVRW